MYTLVLNRIFRYNLIVKGYRKTRSLSFRTKDYFTIIATWVALRYTKADIELPISFKSVTPKIKAFLTPSIKVVTFPMTIATKLKGYLGWELFVFPVIDWGMRVYHKAQGAISVPIGLAYDLIIGKFYMLYEHDPKTLGFMDDFTLKDLDYSEIT